MVAAVAMRIGSPSEVWAPEANHRRIAGVVRCEEPALKKPRTTRNKLASESGAETLLESLGRRDALPPTLGGALRKLAEWVA